MISSHTCGNQTVITKPWEKIKAKSFDSPPTPSTYTVSTENLWAIYYWLSSRVFKTEYEVYPQKRSLNRSKKKHLGGLTE